jgi:transposase
MDEVRLVLTDAAWEEIAEVLHKAKRADGRPPVQRDRMFLEAVLYNARTGIPWRDLPACFGNWDAVYNRCRRWEQSGVWRKFWARLQDEKFKSAKHIFIDSTIVRTHQHAAGALKKTVDRRHRLWDVLGEDFRRKSMLGVYMKRQGCLSSLLVGSVVICRGLTRS